MYLRVAKKEGDDTPESKKPVTASHLKKWNKLIQFSKDRGYAGNPELDHNPVLRKKIFDEFNRAYPEDAITEDFVKPIQNEIQTYKQKALGDIRANPTSYSGNPEHFMSGISQVDGIFGQKTSQWQFPLNYVLDKETGEKNSIGLADKKTLLKVLANK